MLKKIITILISLCFVIILLSKHEANAEIVNPYQHYTYNEMTRDISRLAAQYPSFISYRSIGKTPYGRDIWAVKIGKGDAALLLNASHHAREWPTTNLVMEMLEQYAHAYQTNGKIAGLSTRQYLNETSIWFIPMVNPDGVTLSQSGLSAFPASVHQSLINMNAGSRDFKRWKSNAQGIDLNRQYPAGWYLSQERVPWYKNYSGTRPLEAPEALAMFDFTNWLKPEASISYHSSGHILYWHNGQTGEQYNRDYSIAKVIGNITGYSLVRPNPLQTGAGYTDWFIQNFKKPGFTPEISPPVYETTPSLSILPNELQRNRGVGIYLAKVSNQIWESQLRQVNWIITTVDKQQAFTRPDENHSTSITLPQGTYKVNATIPNWIRYIHPTYGPLWISNANIIGGAPQSMDELALLNSDTNMYEKPSVQSGSLPIKAQPVRLKYQLGTLFGINTDIGIRWVEGDKVIRNYNPIAINAIYNVIRDAKAYRSPTEGSEERGSVITGQNVDATFTWNGWVAVKLANNTTGWVKIDGNLLYDKVLNGAKKAAVINEPILITQTKEVYSQPSESYKTNSTIQPQEAKLVKVYNGWFAIETDSGVVWITDEHIKRNYNPIDIQAYYNVITTTNAYMYPSEDTVVRTTVNVGDTLDAFHTWNGWVEVKLGDTTGWVKIDGNLLYDKVLNGKYSATPLNEMMLVTVDKLLHSKPSLSTSSGIVLKPQSVRVIKEYGNWYAIKTDIGDLWLTKDDIERNYNPISINVYYNVIRNATAFKYPSEKTEVRGTIENGDNVQAIYIWNDWVAVKLGHTIGWVKIDGNLLYDRVKNS